MAAELGWDRAREQSEIDACNPVASAARQSGAAGP
jgi:hypothetical protein